MFCGDQNVPQGTEDVIPLWLAKKLAYVAQQHHPERQPTYKDYSYENLADFPSGTPKSEREVGAIPKAFKLPGICAECNRGWMSRLEQAVILVMEGFILRGTPKLLTPYDQLVLSTWMTKTCLTYDAAAEPIRLISEERGTRAFFQRPFPPWNSYVHIGHDPNHTPEGSIGHRRGWRHGDYRVSGQPVIPVHIARFSFQFDYLILTAGIHYGEDDLANYGLIQTVAPPDSPYFHQIWPPVERFLWPSDAALIPGGGPHSLRPPTGD
jgi:hypothetical protein